MLLRGPGRRRLAAGKRFALAMHGLERDQHLLVLQGVARVALLDGGGEARKRVRLRLASHHGSEIEDRLHRSRPGLGFLPGLVSSGLAYFRYG